MLTDAHCRNASCPPDRKQARFTDAGGLYLQVSPSGSKRWFYKYRVDGKEKQLALGSYPSVGLTAARNAAKLKRAEGRDPIAGENWRTERWGGELWYLSGGGARMTVEVLIVPSEHYLGA